MPRFDKCNIKELEEFIYYSYIHDAKLTSVKYDADGNILRIEASNPIFNAKIDLTFHDVSVVFAISGNEPGSSDTIISLTAEEDFSYLHNYLKQYNNNLRDSLYLLFQMLSGGELHIVSRSVTAEGKK